MTYAGMNDGEDDDTFTILTRFIFAMARRYWLRPSFDKLAKHPLVISHPQALHES